MNFLGLGGCFFGHTEGSSLRGQQISIPHLYLKFQTSVVEEVKFTYQNLSGLKIIFSEYMKPKFLGKIMPFHVNVYYGFFD